MPLDTSTYSLALLRLDGRRWNELRRLTAQISTQAAADGSSYLEMGNTKVLCTVTGPSEERRRTGAAAAGSQDDNASVTVEVNIAGFSGVERKRKGKGDRRTADLQQTLTATFTPVIFTALYPRSTIALHLHVLAQDGSLLAACLNAATLALVDAGIPMADYVVACTSGTTVHVNAHAHDNGDDHDNDADPLLDLNGSEEQELPFLTVGTLGATDKVSVLLMETRVPIGRLEGMLAVGVDGCKQVREILDHVVRRHGKKLLQGAVT